MPDHDTTHAETPKQKKARLRHEIAQLDLNIADLEAKKAALRKELTAG
jgi:phage shock protein A